MMPREDLVTPRRVGGAPLKVSRYRILERIGKGAMGIVYSARDDRMPRDVAVKVMLADLEGEPEIRARFFREAQLAGRLVHRNIVTIFDTGEDEGRLFIVMELLRGRTLAEYLKTPDVPLEAKLDVMTQICEGLAVASAAGIFHRDVKPGNLFVQHDGSVKILDFGIARLASSNMTASGFIVGTPDYMAPEQARGQEVDQRSDIFSAGAVFYFMLSGRKPFAAQDLPAVLHKVISEDPLPLRETESPPALTRVIARMLAKDPARRYQGFRDVLTDLVRVSKRYDAETRLHAQAALKICDTIQALAAEEVRCAAALDVPAGRPPADALQEIAGDHPRLAERGLAALKTVRVWRGVVDRVRVRLDAVHAEVEERTRLVREALGHVEAGRARRQTGDVAGAILEFDAALRLVQGSEALLEDVAECRREAAERQAADEHVAALLAQSADSRATGRVDAALVLAEQAFALRPDSVPAAQAVSALRAAVTRAAAERRRAAERHLERARRAGARGQFADAETALALARAADADPALVERLATELSGQQRASEAADQHNRLAAEAVAAAWSAVRSGHGAAAISLVEELQRQDPRSRLEREVTRLRAEQTRIADETRRREAAAAAIDAAEVASRAGDVAAALRWAEQALVVAPDDRRARQIAAVARVGLREQALRQARLDRAAAHVEAARSELARGRFDRAIREAARAAELNPELEAPAALTAQVLRAQEDADAARARDLAAAQRRRAARGTLAAARAALQAKNFVQARWAAENALAIDPASAEARDVVRLAMAAAASTSEDETVDVLSPDSEDTASLRIDHHRSGAAAYISLVRERLQMARDGASRALARLRSMAR